MKEMMRHLVQSGGYSDDEEDLPSSTNDFKRRMNQNSLPDTFTNGESQGPDMEMKGTSIVGSRAPSSTRMIPNQPLPVIGEHVKPGEEGKDGYARIGNEAKKEHFKTIDWFIDRDLARKKKRAFRLRNRSRLCGVASNWFWNVQGWIVLFLVGAASAFTGSVIHQIASWMSGLKFGFCRGHGFWVSRTLCCIESERTTCDAWANWSEILMDRDSGSYWLDYLIYVISGLLFATTSSYICSSYCPLSLGSGIAGTKVVLGGFIIRNFLSGATLIIKSVGLVLAVASGLSLGLQGPLVHIACCWGAIFVRLFPKYKENEAMKREIYSASCAAGVTAAFGAPLGGVLFSLEAMSSFFPPKTMWRSFWCAISTAVFLKYFNPYGSATEYAAGKLVQFQVFYKGESWLWFELVFFALLGIIGGLAGALFVKINSKLHRIRRGTLWFRKNRLLEIIIIATITTVVAFSNIFAAEGQSFLLEHLFSHCTELRTSLDDQLTDSICTEDTQKRWKLMLLLLAAGIGRYILTIVTFGSQVPSGLFMPTLVVGACVGRLLGWLVTTWHESVGDVYPFTGCTGRTDCIFPSLYAVVGAAAFLGGTTRLTISLAVIMLELTGGLDYMVPLMVAVVPSKWVGDAFGKEGVFDMLITLQGYPHINPGIELGSTATASALMSTSVIYLQKFGETLESLEEICSNFSFHGFPIVESRHNLQVVGLIARRDIERALKDSEDVGLRTRVAFATDNVPGRLVDFFDLSRSVDRDPVIVRPTMPADRVLDIFKALGIRTIFVCRSDGILLGVIKKKDMVKHIHTERALRNSIARDTAPTSLRREVNSFASEYRRSSRLQL
eukprot:CAMPEP_0184500012 /NCGR_PEP_ID=MMETSP0113_2-20130426/43316_1 /TAXON_ID=91329 /ORGANISM="Norrisiella sphaerica, Strain BC52" /LENGTH=838 /DNA_ID=CAMNT_0026888191 /DNA_START=142 /DNA_END=2658 /DNA_ORIENTATION=+